jgi:tetratricopeptide (TPR) repeat protein
MKQLALTIIMMLTTSVAAGERLEAAIAALEQGRIAESRAELVQLVKADPASPSLRYWLGRTHLASGDTGLAIDELAISVELDETRPEVHLWLGRAYLAELQSGGGLRQAFLAGKVRTSFEKAVELDPSSVEARISLAGYYLSAPLIAGGSRKKALGQAEAIVKLDLVEGSLLLARIHSEKKEWDQAEAALLRVLEVHPEHAEAHFLLGRTYQDAERWPEAARSFEAAIAANPELPLAWYQLGRTGALSGSNLDRSLAAIEVYLERFADAGPPVYRTGAWWRKGTILEKKGLTDDAIAAYQRALETDPGYENARTSLEALKGARGPGK